MATGFLESPEISGLLYKRRGGFGKMMPNAWQYRFFAVTKDGALLYFDTEIPDVDHLETKARGKLDLKAANFEISTEPIEGAPTPHALSIAAANEEKWKMCSDTKEDQARWLRVFSKYMLPENKSLSRGPISYTSDDDDRPSRGLSKTSSTIVSNPPSSAATKDEQPKPVISPTNSVQAESSAKLAASTHTQHNNNKKRLKASTHVAPNYDDRDKYEIILVLAIVNICFIGLLRAASVLAMMFFVSIGNFVVAYTLRLRASRVKKAELQQQAAVAAAEKIAMGTAAATSQSPEKAATISSSKASAISSSEESDEKVAVKTKPIAGILNLCIDLLQLKLF